MQKDERAKRSNALRQEIIDTSLEIALKQGLGALSVRNISEAMGYTTGVIYYHFKDKDEIIDEILRQQGQVLQSEIAKAAKNAKNMEENLRAVFYHVFLLARQKPPLYSLIARQFLSGNMQSSAPFLSLEQNFARAYSGTDVNARALAHAVWSSFIGFNLSISQMQNVSQKQADEFFEAQLGMVLNGLPK